jgi:membrane peptidoglycan carboxypeptidase
VVLAWILEHLTGVPKRRLLEIYLNIIEWGPAVHGADEASRFYFDHDAGSLTVAEALFLATVVPAPSRWRWRFDDHGELRRFTQAQMHFIGRAMVAKGWLDPAQLPGTDSLRVELRGPARDIVMPEGRRPAPGPPACRRRMPMARSRRTERPRRAPAERSATRRRRRPRVRPARRGSPAWLGVVAALVVLLWACRGAPLGVAVADDYSFLDRLHFQHRSIRSTRWARRSIGGRCRGNFISR